MMDYNRVVCLSTKAKLYLGYVLDHDYRWNVVVSNVQKLGSPPTNQLVLNEGNAKQIYERLAQTPIQVCCL